MIVIFGFLYFRPEKTTPKDTGTGTNFFSPFNPFGTKPTPPVVKPPVDVSGYVPPPETIQSKLMKVSTMPIAGFTVFQKERLKEVPLAPLLVEEGVGGGDSKLPPRPLGTPPKKGGEKTKKPTPPPTEFVPALRYVAKANGNIYQTFVDKIEERKFSTTIIPKIHEAFFGNSGESVIMRYLKLDDQTIETFVGTLPKELLGGDTIGNNEVKGSFLPNNIKDISLSPDTSKMFYLFVSENNLVDNMIGTTLNFLNNKKVQVFDSPFTEWLSQWPNSNMITLSTKPSANVPGYMYTIDSAGRNLTKILGDINGLTTLMSPNGKLILYGDNNLSLNVYDIDTRNSNVLGVKTLPEKCLWKKGGKASDVIYCAVPEFINSGQYPDSWYQGEVSFSDQLWKIDVKTGNATIIVDPITVVGGEEIDGIKLSLDESENYLFFVNKKDSFLWKFDLK